MACVLRVVVVGGLAGAPPGLDRATSRKDVVRDLCSDHPAPGTADHGKPSHDHADLLVFALLPR